MEQKIEDDLLFNEEVLNRLRSLQEFLMVNGVPSAKVNELYRYYFKLRELTISSRDVGTL